MTIKSAANTPRAKDNGEEKPEASERKLNLLVVEDDEKILEAISEYFSRAGYNVQTAEDGLSGVQAALNEDRKSTRLNSSHLGSSYAVCCLKKNRPGRRIAGRALAANAGREPRGAARCAGQGAGLVVAGHRR